MNQTHPLVRLMLIFHEYDWIEIVLRFVFITACVALGTWIGG